MTTPTPEVALELERLRGVVGIGFAEVKGELGVIRENSNQAAKDIAAQSNRINSLGTRVTTVERKLAVMAGASATFGAITGIVTGILAAYLSR